MTPDGEESLPSRQQAHPEQDAESFPVIALAECLEPLEFRTNGLAPIAGVHDLNAMGTGVF